MAINTRLILAVVGGVLGGFFISMLTRSETSGDRIVAAARRDQSQAVVLIGADHRKVSVLDRETGKPIKDCGTSECISDVVISELGDPQLVIKATGKPVHPSDVFSVQRVYRYDFKVNPRCYRYWPGGEICY